MRYIKPYEKINNGPKIGDYILPKIKYNVQSPWAIFVNNTIGVIYHISTRDKETYEIVVYYKEEDVPEEFKHIELFPTDNKKTHYYKILLLNKDTFYYSKKREDLDIISDQTKYNL